MHCAWKSLACTTVFGALSLGLVGAGRPGLADDVDRQIAAIAKVGPFGQGSAKARQACDDLSRGDAKILPRLLAAMDTPNIVAANWYRAAYERIVARELAGRHPDFPVDAFKACVLDAGRRGAARRLALGLLDRIEPSFGETHLPTWVDDPEFRDDAVAIVLKQADAARSRGEVDLAQRRYAAAFQHARNAEQVRAAAARLESMGKTVSIVGHLGFVIDWYLIGPFAAPGMSGFATPFPPENSIDLQAPLTSGGKPLRWTRHQTSDPLGTVDLVRVLGPVKEAVGYAYTELDFPAARDLELRCSADDCLAVWLNGDKVFGRAMWLNGTRLDRFITPVHLRAGRNRVLVKVCQGPQHRDPAVGNAWTFQLRFCSPDGAGSAFQSALEQAGRAGQVPPAHSAEKR